MNAVTAFEHRTEQLREHLLAAKDMQQAVFACTMALEQMACELAQDEQDEAARQRQQAVMAIVRRVPAVLQAGRARGELVVSEQEEKAETGLDRFGRGMQMIGVLALCGLAVYEYLTGDRHLALVQALGALLFTAGSIRMQPAQKETPAKARGVAYADADTVIAQLTALCEAADICMQDLALVEQAGGRARLSGSADDAMLDLLVALMEAKESGRDAMAMRSLSLAEEYLHMLGVEIVPYSAEQAAMFDTLPTLSGARTIRPALVKDGKMLRRGVAAVAAVKEGGMGA